MRKVVLLDLDDTINECGKQFWSLHEQHFGELIDQNDVIDWDLAKFSSKGKEVYHLFTTPGFFRSLELKRYAETLVKNLNERYDLYFVTDAPSGTSHCDEGLEFANPVADKRKWVEQHFPFFDASKIIFCAHKWMVIGDVLVDDKPATFYEFQKRGRPFILMDAPHNRSIETKYRAHSLEDVERMVNELLYEQNERS